MTGGEKSGDAKADVAREKFARNDSSLDNAITRLEIRAEMKSSNEDEISSVIDQRALEAQRRKESEPPASGYGKQVILFVRSVRGWPQTLVALGILGLVGYYLYLHSGSLPHK